MTDMSTVPADACGSAREQLFEQLEKDGISVHRPGDRPLFTREPETEMVPMHWRWGDLEGYLAELGQVVDLDAGGPRRTLRLANPGLAYGTTPTFWASIQYINPDEVATAHRHTAAAFRFVMQGTGCSTTVDGEKYDMHEGDLVLTPTWAWHDHVHKGAEPMIWLDVLDISLMRSLENVFFELHPDDIQPIVDQPERSFREFGSGLLRPVGPGPRRSDNPLLVYTNAQTLQALERAKGLPPDPCDDVILEYQNPTSGGPAMPSLSIKAQLLRPGFSGVRHRHSGSKVYLVVEGAGTSEVNDSHFSWSRGDFISVPPWATVRHRNPYETEARLFRVDDSAVLHALNVYRHQILDVAEQDGDR